MFKCTCVWSLWITSKYYKKENEWNARAISNGKCGEYVSTDNTLFNQRNVIRRAMLCLFVSGATAATQFRYESVDSRRRRRANMCAMHGAFDLQSFAKHLKLRNLSLSALLYDFFSTAVDSAVIAFVFHSLSTSSSCALLFRQLILWAAHNRKHFLWSLGHNTNTGCCFL